MTVKERTLILELKNGDTRKITLPGDWKVTFGNVLPYQGKEQRNSVEHRIALRIYGKSKNDLKAVMLDVVSFREEGTIKISEKQTKIQRQATQQKTPQGAKDVVLEARVTRWVNPDDDADVANDIPEEFLKLPHVTE